MSVTTKVMASFSAFDELGQLVLHCGHCPRWIAQFRGPPWAHGAELSAKLRVFDQPSQGARQLLDGWRNQYAAVGVDDFFRRAHRGAHHGQSRIKRFDKCDAE